MAKKRFFYGIVGAVFFWFIKGFRNTFEEEMAKKNNRRNVIASFVIWVFLYLLIRKV